MIYKMHFGNRLYPNTSLCIGVQYSQYCVYYVVHCILSLCRFKQPREAALSTTESESEVVNRPRRVPQSRRCHSQEDSESEVHVSHTKL